MKLFHALGLLKARLKRQNLLKLYYNDPDNLVSSRQNTKLEHIMQLNCKEVNSQESFETARTSRSFDQRGIQKMLLL